MDEQDYGPVDCECAGWTCVGVTVMAGMTVGMHHPGCRRAEKFPPGVFVEEVCRRLFTRNSQLEHENMGIRNELKEARDLLGQARDEIDAIAAMITRDS